MQSFIEKIRDFMFGRNGIDKLSIFLVIAYLLINGLKMVFLRLNYTVYLVMWVVALSVLGFAAFRVLSKNLAKRQYENEKFEQFLFKIKFRQFGIGIKKKGNRAKVRFEQRKTHRFRTCPNCNEHLRMSKKRGKRDITCPKCGTQFKVHILF